MKKRKALAITVSAKRRRLRKKQERSKLKTIQELHEGPNYMTNLLMSVGDDLPITIPSPVFAPTVENLGNIPANHIYFDLETTGLGRCEHIIQIAACRGEKTFNRYVNTNKQIGLKASEITKIDIIGDQMFYKNTAVDSVGIKTALSNFIDFLSETHDNVLIGHNCKAFDCPLLFNALKNCDLIQDFAKCVKGFVDTRLVFKDIKPCTQQSLANNFSLSEYNAHNAIDDVNMLKRIVDKALPDVDKFIQSSYTIGYCIQMQDYLKTVSANLPSLQPLVTSKVISLVMAKKIAGSGLSMDHLILAFQRNGLSGVDDLFSNTCNNRVRVTKSQRVIRAVWAYINRYNDIK